MARPCLTRAPSVALLISALIVPAVPPAALASASPRLVVTAPPGFAVKPIPKDGSYAEEYEIASRTDDDVGCQVGFDPSKALPGQSQAEINTAAGGSEYAAIANASVAAAFDVDHTEPFSMQGAKGFAMTGAPKGAAGQARALLFLLQTPPGRTVVSCVSAPARFDALRPTFDRIVRGVTLPR